MVRTILVDAQRVEEGRLVLEVLKKAKIKVNAALWEYGDFTFVGWDLLLVLPDVETIGYHETLNKVRDLLSKQGLGHIEVHIMTPEAGYAQRLSRSLGGHPEGDLLKEPMDTEGTLIDRGYLYFVK